MHILRKTGTIDLSIAGYDLPDLQAVLGHTRNEQIGATGAYLLTPLRRRLRVAETYFGWPDALPERLPEWPQIAPLLGFTDDEPPDPPHPHRAAASEFAGRRCHRPHGRRKVTRHPQTSITHDPRRHHP